MDPSEFEGTVERSSDALTLTTLEELLDNNNHPKFIKLDLEKESNDLYLSVFKVKEALKKWDEVSLANLRLAWDEQAIKIAELKEEVSARKKTLALLIRQFTNRFLVSSESKEEEEIVTTGNVLVAAFKSEFDFVNTSSRFAETAFLSTYKILRDIPDPIEESEACLAICLRAQEALKNAQEQLNIAAIQLENSVNPSNNSTATISAPSVFTSQHNTAALEEALSAKYEAKREEQYLQYQSEISDMRVKHDNELRNRENALRNAFERQQLELQQESERAIARKETEVASLLSSLNDYNQKNIESEEREKLLTSEATKRRDLEDRLRVTLTDLASAQTATSELQNKYELTVNRIHSLENSLDKHDKTSQLTIDQLKQELSTTQQKLTSVENDLLSRPPVDFSALAENIAMAGGSASDGRLGTSSLGHHVLSWSKMETNIIESIRKASYEATASRVKEQEAVAALRLAKEECDQLTSRLAEQDRIVSALERDLVAAHQAVDAGKALIKCYNNKQSGDVFDAVIKEHEDKEKAKQQQTILVKATTVHASGTMSDGWGDDDLDVDTPVKPKVRDHHEDNGHDIDVEKGSGGRGTALVVLGGLDAGDRMLQAVQSQRDRFMKLFHEKENEVSVLRKRLERATDDMLTLRNENLELYRRLRVVRANSRGAVVSHTAPKGVTAALSSTGELHFDDDGNYLFAGPNNSKPSTRDLLGGPGLGSSSSSVVTPNKNHGRGGRRDVKAHTASSASSEIQAMDGDALDRKYLHLYEQKIDPFQMEELDRQGVLARMNLFERGLAYVTKFFLADQWARHALMVYLLLVHLFALGYVMQVLNPQLISEVDAHIKDKWIRQVFESEHPDI